MGPALRIAQIITSRMRLKGNVLNVWLMIVRNVKHQVLARSVSREITSSLIKRPAKVIVLLNILKTRLVGSVPRALKIVMSVRTLWNVSTAQMNTLSPTPANASPVS